MRILLAILLTLLPASVYAAKPQPLFCNHPLVDAMQRQNCLDTFKANGKERISLGAWTVLGYTDLMDDSQHFEAELKASAKQIASKFKTKLEFLCREGDEPTVGFSWRIDGKPKARLTYRFDYGEPAETRTVRGATRIKEMKRSEIHWEYRTAFMDELEVSKRLVIRMVWVHNTTKNDIQYDDVFELGGSELVLQPIRKLCSW